MPGFRQLTMDDMRRRAAERVRIRTMRLKHEGPPWSPLMLLESGCAMLRRGIPAHARALVLRYVLEDTRRPEIYGRDLLAAHWKRAEAARLAAIEMGEILADYGARHFREMEKETRKRLKFLARQQIQALEPSLHGLDPGPLTTLGSLRKVFPCGLESGLHGPKLIKLALEKTQSAHFSSSLYELWEIRRRLHVEIPPRCLFTF